MPKQIPDQELDAILAVVAAHPEGVRVSTIRKGLPYELPPRMLQRRLALLADQHRLTAEGRGKGRRYRAPIQHRRPVGYRRDFLDNYRPNVTYYLPAETRQRLLDMGRPPDGERPAGTYARTIYSRLLIDLSWNSSRLEGNTYSLLETERLLELGEAAEGKAALEAQMILNH
jgi:hypothetical protein